MQVVDNSINVVLLGDWNRIYLSPAWLATELFQSAPVQILIEGVDDRATLTIIKDNIAIIPARDKFIFRCTSLTEDNVEKLTSCVDAFVKKAKVPVLSAYGFNLKYVDDESMILSQLFDDIKDRDVFLKNGYNIQENGLHRKIVRDDIVINIEQSLEGSQEEISFNEHHEIANADTLTITGEAFMAFVQRTEGLLLDMGYSLEEE